MRDQWDRRQFLRQVSATTGALMLSAKRLLASGALAAGKGEELEIQIGTVSPCTVRLSLLPSNNGSLGTIPTNGSLVRESWGAPVARLGGDWRGQVVNAANLRVHVEPSPLTFIIENANGERIQTLAVERNTGVVQFETGSSPLLGLGEGGPQFDRRGSVDRMISGQGGSKLKTHGGRVPIPWVIGTSGWAIFFHQPFGTFDLTGTKAKFQPASEGAALPLDLFFVVSPDPSTIMAEYARITGPAEMPPLWSFGYQQSHRTLASREEVL